jgi:hypothetical protein
MIDHQVSQARERILGYDLARSLALLGMIVAHFGLVMSSDLTQSAWADTAVRDKARSLLSRIKVGSDEASPSRRLR